RCSAPLQSRSRETMDRFAEAAEELLREKPFEEISIQSIVRRSKRPIGSFYARFPSKEALLPYLYERYHRGLEPLFAARLARVDWDALDFDETIAGVVDFLMATYDERRWLMRALVLFTRTRPDAVSPEMIEGRRRVFDRVGAILLRHRSRIAHADPAAAIRFGIFLVSSVAREKLLFDAPHSRITPMTRRQLRDELIRTLDSYLTARSPR
ncbi:MAG: TetR/AcrR family transcriptional regulator, partial [Candidatus Eiseniibacteriota bacterium]